MLPYLGWVTLATALNYTIWQMNKPAIKEEWLLYNFHQQVSYHKSLVKEAVMDRSSHLYCLNKWPKTTKIFLSLFYSEKLYFFTPVICNACTLVKKL